MGAGMALSRNFGLRAAVAALAAAAVLAGCSSSGQGVTNDISRIGQVLGQKSRAAPRTGEVALPTRAALDAAPAPLIAMVVESPGAGALLGRIAMNRDVATYATADGVTVSLRDGVLVQTRGLGSDLMSAGVPTAGRLAAGGSHNRVHHYVGPEDRIVPRSFDCRIADAGGERLTIAQLSYDTRIVAERCTGVDGDTFENRFWFDNRGKIRQSRQWVGQGVGFVRLQDLAR